MTKFIFWESCHSKLEIRIEAKMRHLPQSVIKNMLFIMIIVMEKN